MMWAPHSDCLCVFGKRRQSTPLFEDRPDEWFEEDQQGFDEHGGMDDIQGLDVLLVPGEKRGGAGEVPFSWSL